MGKVILVIVLILAALWGYGFFKAMAQVNDGLSLLGAGFTDYSMNPISKLGYRFYLKYFTDAGSRINNLLNIFD